MFIIYNHVGIALCILALFGGWAVKFSAWALGVRESAIDSMFVASWCAVLALLDLACRSIGVFDSSKSWGRFITPSSGGQIFFIPVWILATGLLSYQVGRLFV